MGCIVDRNYPMKSSGDHARFRIEVFSSSDDSRGLMLTKKFRRLGYGVRSVIVTDNYLLNVHLSDEEVASLAEMLVQPVTQSYTLNTPYVPKDFDFAIEVGYLPGVTDNIAHTVRESAEDLLGKRLDPEKSVFSSMTYFISGDISSEDMITLAGEFFNPLIQRCQILKSDDYMSSGGFGYSIPVVHLAGYVHADSVNLHVDDDDLVRIGREGIANPDGTRRGPLALDMASMKTIQKYYAEIEKRNPTDVELESIAQTWSEHCKHTIFAARIDDVEQGIFKAYIRAATEKVRQDKGERDFCISVFTDNSGGIAFDERYMVSDKVETHNSPSALDPFGGSITGIVGVNRDTIGFGLAARPIANRYGFCFADPFDSKPLYRGKDINTRLLSPRRIMEGVIHGVNVGGNCSGIPTPQGFMYFDDRYRGKPLVFVGTVGLIPRNLKGRQSHIKKAIPGDLIVMAGGRVGLDGIHGATFSSEALSVGSPATAVQIGDPITQKKLSDAIVKEARDLNLYNSITDNGAGGLSCSVAEMAKESGGFEVELEKVPLKYPGMAPWQIWVSESQERMTLAVPPNKIDACLELMERRGVEATVIGTFTDTGRGIVTFMGTQVFNLDLDFLHEGLPKKNLFTAHKEKDRRRAVFDEPSNMTAVLHDMLRRLNIASFDFVSTQYDHEVQSNSVIKPLQGRGRVNGNTTVIRPVPDSFRGVVLSQALYPSYSDIDTYRMAACSIDTAVRNAISAGGTINALALLDNFCWCDSTNPERLAELRDAARACYDCAVAYGTPFISGKDSMFNDFRGFDENLNEITVSIPPTLLVSSIGIVDDVRRCQTIDFKFPGDLIFLVGETFDEIGQSEYLAYTAERNPDVDIPCDEVPAVNTKINLAVYRAMEAAIQKELVSSCISVERGGVAIALAKSSMAGMLGFTASIAAFSRLPRCDHALFSESQGRFLVSVDPAREVEFVEECKNLPLSKIGQVTDGGRCVIRNNENAVCIDTTVSALLNSYKSIFKDF
jgi:phosphoribosylformylglycinamidine synthase